MPGKMIKNTDHYTITWDEDVEAVIHTWEKFARGETFRDGCEELLDVIKEQDASKLLVDTRNVTAHNDEDQEWLQREWVPRMIDAGVEYSVNVHPESVISEMEMEDIHDDLADIPGETAMMSDIDEARRWLEQQ